jgi:hypothetical protein
MRVEAYKNRGYAMVSVSVRDASSGVLLPGAIERAARSRRFGVEAGTRAAASFPRPFLR